MNISYICSGDFLLPDLKLPEETRPIGKWGRMHRDYFEEHHPIRFNNLVLSGNLWTFLPCQKARTTNTAGNTKRKVLPTFLCWLF